MKTAHLRWPRSYTIAVTCLLVDAFLVNFAAYGVTDQQCADAAHNQGMLASVDGDVVYNMHSCTSIPTNKFHQCACTGTLKGGAAGECAVYTWDYNVGGVTINGGGIGSDC